MRQTVTLGDMFFHYHNTRSTVSFNSIQHTTSCCPKYTLDLKLCINHQLKIVPQKCGTVTT